MAVYNPRAILQGDEPGPWGPSVPVAYDQRDVLLYAVGIGCQDLRLIYERHPQFAVFPSFAIRWGALGAQVDRSALPPSPGPLTIDAERLLEQIAPLPTSGTVQVRSRLLAVHPRGKGSAFTEYESEVLDDGGRLCTRITTGIFTRGVQQLGDIEPFEGVGTSRSEKISVPERAPDVQVQARIAENQAALYRLSGDWNPLHIDAESARFGGFPAPILHGLCTYGHTAQLLVGALCGGDPARMRALKARFSAPVYPGDTLQVLAWHDGPGRVLVEARVQGGLAGDRTVVNNAWFTWA